MKVTDRLGDGLVDRLVEVDDIFDPGLVDQTRVDPQPQQSPVVHLQLKHTDPAGNEQYYTSRSDEDGTFLR